MRPVVLAVVATMVPLSAQVQVLIQEGRTVYHRPGTDPAFHAGGIGIPPKGMDPHLWYVYDPYILQYSRNAGVDPVLTKALIYCESRFQWRATSRAKARGLMQIMDSTATRLGGARSNQGLGPYDPVENIRLGVQYLSVLQNRYAGNLIKITAAYNAGEGAVDRHGGIPPFRETKAYVPAVLSLWSRINAGS